MEKFGNEQLMKMIRAWKSKSLNSKFMERYKIPLERKNPPIDDRNKNFQNLKTEERQKKSQQFKNQMLLPEPIFIKINEQIFCSHVYASLTIFKLLNQAQKQIYKPKQNEKEKTFLTIPYQFEQNIKFVAGNNTDYIYVGLENQLHILKAQYTQQANEQNVLYKNLKEFKLVQKKKVPRLKGVTFFKEGAQNSYIVAITTEKLIKYRIASLSSTNQKHRERESKQEYDKVDQIKISFQNKKDYLIYSQVNTIKVLVEGTNTLFVFATREDVKQEVNQKGKVKDRKIQSLYLFKFTLEQRAKLNQSIPIRSSIVQSNNPSNLIIVPEISVIDHVFDTGLFSKSKIYQIDQDVFLISLYEQIIVVKYHFSKYVVWDNISLAPTKSIQKKGQLVLADKIVMVYTESGQIYAHNIYFCPEENKLKFPRIDNFKGNVNEDQILYDAIVLQYQPGSFMKVLIYFKQNQVYTPSNKYMVHKQEKMQGEHKQLLFYIRCIQQNQPVDKLQQLFRNKKTPQQISEFVQRFNITEIEKSKCEWSVSDKTQNDIYNLLLEIKDNGYIQNELTTILKSNPHDVKFLSKIEQKQIARYKKMLLTKLLKLDQQYDPQKVNFLYQTYGTYYNKEQIIEIKKIIQWVMQSIMFQKKFNYCQNFLEFMEYDFIQIGKLKAASLKEEIKLLSCKGFEKRLQYFLNSFKYMILANFEDIFEFLIQNKSEEEVQKFFKDHYPFIFPRFEERSMVFMKKKSRKVSFAKPKDMDFYDFKKEMGIKDQQQKNYAEQIVRCQLWQDKFDDPQEIKKIQTKDSFEKQIVRELQKYIKIEPSYIEPKRMSIRQQKQKQKALEVVSNLVSNSDLKSEPSPLNIKAEDAISEFNKILNQFVKQDWFKNNKSKQHSIIQIDVETLKNKFDYFKRIGVFNLLIKFFYHKIAEGIYSQARVDRILESFKNAWLIPESFQQNILIRREVYRKISQLKNPDLELPLLQDFLIMQETQFFDYIFLNYRQMVLKQVKGVYHAALPGLFKEKFEIYLNSEKVKLTQIIKFLEFFEGNSNVDIRMDVFTCVKKLLKINDRFNTSFFIDRLMQLQILKRDGSTHSVIDQLIDEAKIAFGCYFYNFFNLFKIENTYRDLIQETFQQNYENCPILQTILKKYCTGDFNELEVVKEISGEQNNENNIEEQQSEEERAMIKFEACFGLEQIQFSITNHPLQFFGIILYLIDTLRFQVLPETIFDRFLQLLLETRNYDEIYDFISDFKANIAGEQNEEFSESENPGDEIQAKNYLLLKRFYQESNFTIEDRLIDNILIWTRREYKKSLDSISQRNVPSRSDIVVHFNSVFERVTKTFQRVVQQLNLEKQSQKGLQIRKQKSFLSMLKNVKEIEPSLVIHILKMRFENQRFDGNYLQQKSPLLNELSSFELMIHLLNAIPKEKFDEKQSGTILKQIYLMECIYQQFISSSNFKQNAQQPQDQSEVGLSRFFIQLAIRLMKNKQFTYCKFLLIHRSINKDVYYQFLSLIQPNMSKPTQEQFRRFIQDFVKIQHSKTMSKMFSSFIQQNGIVSFINEQSNKDSQQSKNKDVLKFMIQPLMDSKIMKNKSVEPIKLDKHTVIIFQSLTQAHRVDEAFYFLVRNNMLSVLKAMQSKNFVHKNSQALISIYIKCLKQFLYDNFYPTFTFFKKKHQMLANQFERKDIIKDINIGISRLKEIISEQKLKLGQYLQNSKKLGEKLVVDLCQKTSLQSQRKIANSQPLPFSQKDLQVPHADKRAKRIKDIEEKLGQLKQIYNIFMKSHNLDPNIKLNEEDLDLMLVSESNKFRSDNFESIQNQNSKYLGNMGKNILAEGVPSPRFDGGKRNLFMTDPINTITPQQLAMREDDDVRELEKEKKRIKQTSMFTELQKQINEQIRQSKQLNKKYEEEGEGEVERRLQKAQKLQSRASKRLLQLKEKQKQEIKSMKSSYKSETTERVNKILEDIRARKSKIYEKSQVKSKFSQVSIGQSPSSGRALNDEFDTPSIRIQSLIPNRSKLQSGLIQPPNLDSNTKNEEAKRNFGSQISSQKKYEVHIHGIDGHVRNLFMPGKQKSQIEKKKQSHGEIHLESKNSLPPFEYSSKKIISQIKHETNKKADLLKGNLQKNLSKQVNFNQLIKQFESKQPQCSKYVQKLDLVKNNSQVGLQIIKNIYSIIFSFELFVKLVGYLIDNYPTYSAVLEVKGYRIAVQAMGIQYKINLKDLFPLELFINVKNIPIKQYYRVAYETIRPNLLKIISSPDTNIHGIAILFRFGFGSENIYYYRVYEDYVKTLLKEYSDSTTDEKKLFLLSQKLRSLYSNINPEKRKQKFQQILLSMGNQQKRKILVREMLKIIQRRSEMLSGQKQSDLKDVLLKLN